MNVRLIMFREDGTRRAFPLRTGVTTIGRKDDCTIRIPLAVVSRRHAEITVDTDEVVLKDLGAANGTFLNNTRVTEEDLEPGDQIMIGPVIFAVQIDGEPADGDIIEVRTKLRESHGAQQPAASVRAAKHVYTSDEDVDPIAALEALASSSDQTAIDHDDDTDEEDK